MFLEINKIYFLYIAIYIKYFFPNNNMKKCVKVAIYIFFLQISLIYI